MSIFNNVEYPYLGRRLKGVMSVQRQGKLFCRDQYYQVGFHEELMKFSSEPTRTSIRRYNCRKCNRLVFVYGPTDSLSIRDAIRKGGIINRCSV